MKQIIFLLISILLLSSCKTMKLAENKKSGLVDIGVEYNYGKKAGKFYRPTIDSVIDEVITQFNHESHPFYIHRKNPEDTNYITFNIKRAKYTSVAEKNFGYIYSGIGLIATPIFALAVTGGKGILLFGIFPSDFISVDATLSPNLSANTAGRDKVYISKGALFREDSIRYQKVRLSFKNAIYNEIYSIEKQLTSK